MGILHASTFPDVHFCGVDTSRLEKTDIKQRLQMKDEVGSCISDRQRLTTGLWTSQKALSWLSRIFLSVLSFFLSILQRRSSNVRISAFLVSALHVASGMNDEEGELVGRWKFC